MPLHDIRSVSLPYVLKLQSCGRYVICNREYKPLGFCESSHYRYEDYPILLCLRVTPTLASRLSWSGSTDVSCIYLYSDGCIPTLTSKYWSGYQQRLFTLAKLPLIVESGPGGIFEAERICRLNLNDESKQKRELQEVS